jgi:hypothetical protein
MVPEVSKVVCSKPKTSDEVSRQVSTSIEVSKEDILKFASYWMLVQLLPRL